MSVSRVIKAPLGVQLNRLAFAIYAAFSCLPLWHFRHVGSLEGELIFGGFVFCSFLGLGYSFIRVRRSRWILAVLGLAIPAVFWASMWLMEFSRPAWWEWPFDLVLILVVWMGIPIMLALSLFRDRKTSEYFTKQAA